MTILVAVSGLDGTWIGADSRAEVNGGHVVCMSRLKWNVSPGRTWAFASAGPATFDGIFFNDPNYDPDTKLWPPPHVLGEKGVLSLLANFRSRLDATTEPQVHEDDVARDYHFSPLVAWAGGGIWRTDSTLYTFNNPYLLKSGVRFNAAGCGSEYALGAMFAEGRRGGNAEEVARAGLNAAVRFSSGCDHPLILERLATITIGSPPLLLDDT